MKQFSREKVNKIVEFGKCSSQRGLDVQYLGTVPDRNIFLWTTYDE
jgi:hypothetical protein